MSKPSLPKTASAARSGDQAAFESLFARNIPRLVAFIRARAGGVVAAKESAQDLAQSVCREALQDLDGFEFQGEDAFRNWLFTRAMHKILGRRRWYLRDKRSIEREVNIQLGEDDARSVLTAYATLGTPSRIAGAREELQRIESALHHLPDEQREAVALTRIAGFSYKEVAEQMDRSESAVRGLVLRGLARLSALLEEGDKAPGE